MEPNSKVRAAFDAFKKEAGDGALIYVTIYQGPKEPTAKKTVAPSDTLDLD